MLSQIITLILLIGLININSLILSRNGLHLPINKNKNNLDVTKYTILSVRKINTNKMNTNANLMKLQMIPQVIFAASCALSVFFYVLNNIDDIKLKQKIATGK